MATEYLRPNGAGDETNIASQYPASTYHWDKVDEETADDDSTYVYSNSTSYQRDLYSLSNPTGSGAINFIKVRYRFKRYSAGTGYLTPAIKTGGTAYEGTGDTEAAGSYKDGSYQWTTNPQTGVAWTWDDLTNLQAGIKIKESPGGGHQTRCTQVYVEVDYTAVTEKTSSDAGSGADDKVLDNPIATLTGIETGSGADAPISQLAILTVAETGLGSDAYVSLETWEAKASSDAGSGVEGTPLPSAILAGSETGSGIEVLVARLLATFDTGTSVEVSGVEVGDLLEELFATELGQGSDSLTAKIEIPTKGGGMKLWT